MAKVTTVGQRIEAAAARFDAAGLHFGHGTHDAYDEAAWLMLHALEAPIDDLEARLDHVPTAAQVQRFEALVAARIEKRIPAAYLINEAWLGEHRFYVDERVIVPRSFIAELLADELAPWVVDPAQVGTVLDLCTGSGCLAILAALTFPNARVDAVDLSEEALAVAERNVTDYGLEQRVNLIRSDLFRSVPAKRYDLILSNPPYVDAPSMKALPAEYRHEPAMALGSGRDGLDATRVILREAKKHLADDGLLVVEIGHNRERLERAFPHLPFTWLEVSAGDEFVFLLERRQLP
ncbi:MAG TPA: 50S ribosomal protein L3 N(5)-glutamine methyltransferase [Thermomicrobiales bacterium]|nr:50S ribosomal protein L3 N(5)-glutamine methyltransferase [Thermomicrobiales bacterium]